MVAMRFKLLRSIHQQRKLTGKTCNRCDKGQLKGGRRCSSCRGTGNEMVSHLYRAGESGNDIVESTVNLELVHGSEKFQNVERILSSSGNDALIQELNKLKAENQQLRLEQKNAAEEARAAAEAEATGDELDNLNEEQLKRYAQSYDPAIDISEASGKEEMINTIRADLQLVS